MRSFRDSPLCRYLYPYVVAALLVALTIGGRLAIGVSFGDRPLLLLFVLPILFSAYLGGLGPGLLATAASGLWTSYFVIHPVQQLGIARPVDLFQWVILCVLGILISTLSEAFHRAVHRARQEQKRCADLLGKQREAEIRQAEAARFHAFTRNAPIGIVFGTAEGSIQCANDEYLRIIGYSREDLQAGRLRWDQITPPEWLPADRGAIKQLQTDSVVRYEKEYARPDGTRIPVLIGLIAHDAALACFVLDISREKQAEKKLRFFKYFAEQSSDPFYTISPAEGFRFTYLNDAACRHFGRSRDELLKMSIPDWDPLFPPDRCSRVWEDLRSKKAVTFETVHHHADGHEIPVEIFVTYFEYEGEELCAGWFHDISERKRMEQDLRESEEKFRTVAENAQAVFGIVQGDRFVFANPYLEKISGYSLDEILAMPFANLVHPSFRSLVAERARLRQMGRPVSPHYEFIMVTKSGEERWIELTVGTIEYRGKPAVIGTGFDITDRKRAENALRESEERLRLAVESARIIAWEYDAGTRLWTWTNPDPAWGEGFSTSAGFDEFMALMHADDRQRVKEVFERASEPGSSGHYAAEFRFLRPDGQYRWLSARGQIFFEQQNGAPRPVRALGMSVDTTDQKAAQEMLATAKEAAEQARATAEDASRAKDRFLAVLSHELRTPLTPVLASVSILQKDRSLQHQIREDLEMIRRNVELEARLIDDLLDLTRIVRGKVELDKRPVDLVTVVNRAIEVCRPDIQARELDFGWDAGPGVYIVEADAARLQQVFWNLLKNAIKFTPHAGSVNLRCRLEPDDYVVVEVTDNGVGIDPAHLEHIFEAFAQAEPTTGRRFGGLGLGLAISRSLVELHGGTIEAHSAGPGRGATFTIRLPALVRERSLLQPSWVQRPGTLASAPVQSYRILVVEDHGDTAEMMQRLLELEGHQVRTAGDVAAALEAVMHHKFDLLISDLGLPDGSGVDLLRQLRAAGHTLPAIALSGYGQEQDLEQTKAAGFSAHIVKPVDAERLTAVLESIVSQPIGS